jgi:mannose-1-phosphate guanylyltransferase
MVPVSMGWSDIGDWRALHGAHAPDGAGNVASGNAEFADCRNVMVVSDGPRVSVIGLEGVVVVVDGGEVLVTTHAGAQKVGKLTGAQGN